MPILAAYDDWWLASPRFRYFQAPPAADDGMSRHSVPRVGLRFAGTLMHRALPAAVITDGYAISSEPHRATVTWRTLGFQHTHEAALVQAAQHFRSQLRAEEGPVDTDRLIADFLFMLMQRAGELAYHGDFAMGGRRSTSAKQTEDLDGGAIWIFGGGAADTLETVVAHPNASEPTTPRLAGWPDGSLHLIDGDGDAYDVSGDPELMTMLITEVHRKRRRGDASP